MITECAAFGRIAAESVAFHQDPWRVFPLRVLIGGILHLPAGKDSCRGMTALIRIDRSLPGAPGRAKERPIRFCSRCGHPSEDPPGRAGRFLRERICRRCEMGLMLTCSREALPGVAAAFVIVSFELLVSAVSEAGEKIFGAAQTVIGRPALEVVTSPMGDDSLARPLGHAAPSTPPSLVLPVRLAAGSPRQVGTMAARIATCGPPRA